IPVVSCGMLSILRFVLGNASAGSGHFQSIGAEPHAPEDQPQLNQTPLCNRRLLRYSRADDSHGLPQMTKELWKRLASRAVESLSTTISVLIHTTMHKRFRSVRKFLKLAPDHPLTRSLSTFSSAPGQTRRAVPLWCGSVALCPSV